MKKYRIAFFETEKWELDFLRKNRFLKKYAKPYFTKERLDIKNANLFSDYDIISTFIYSNCGRKILSRFKNLKLIATRSTGTDHIDIKYCEKNNIKVANVPKYGENSVAEHTFALILCLIRKIHICWERTRKSEFSLDSAILGAELHNKTIGVVGTGSIGKKVIEISKGFGMKVLAYDIKPDKKFAKECSFDYVRLDYLYKNSDIITFHVPSTKKTYHMLNSKNLNKFKKGAIIINTSRGSICESKALLKGLRDGVFSLVGLDVLEEECFIKEERELATEDYSKICDIKTALENHILIDHPKVIFTPHSAFYTKESLNTILKTTIQNIKEAANKKP